MGNMFAKKQNLMDDLITYRMTSKSLQRSAKKCEANQVTQRAKLKKALEQRNLEGAKIYGDSCIREKNQALRFLRFSAKIDAVASRLESAMMVQQINVAMGQTVKSMANVLSTMNVDQVSETMEKFEKAFADMDVRTGYMEGAMETSGGMSTSPDEVDALIAMVGDEAGMDMSLLLGAAPEGTALPTAAKPAVSAKPEDALEARLALLRR